MPLPNDQDPLHSTNRESSAPTPARDVTTAAAAPGCLDRADPVVGRGGWASGAQHRERLRLGGGLAFTPDGRRLAVAGGDGVTLYETAYGKKALTLPGPLGPPTGGPPPVFNRLAFTADGKRLVGAFNSSFAPGVVRVWDARPAGSGD